MKVNIISRKRNKLQREISELIREFNSTPMLFLNQRMRIERKIKNRSVKLEQIIYKPEAQNETL